MTRSRAELDAALGRHGLALGDAAADGRRHDGQPGSSATTGARRPSASSSSASSSSTTTDAPDTAPLAAARDPHLRARA